MRIALINWTRLRTGGVETYVGDIMAGLVQRGHEVAFWQETDGAGTWEPIPMPAGVAEWCAGRLGLEHALRALRDWQPDLLYTHVVNDPEVEARTLRVAPAVFFAHGHFGTCVSGLKAFQNPSVRPCQRTFGWECLLHYYPRRCGGLNPLTMWRDYRRQARRLELLHEYAAVVVASDYLRREYLKHGLAEQQVHQVPLPVHGADCSTEVGCAPEANGQAEIRTLRLLESPRYHLLFAGRMDRLKGGAVLLEALPRVLEKLGRGVQVTFAGDGPERPKWEQEAARLQARHPALSIDFAGWLNQTQLSELHPRCDLIVVPSLLPETFGLVGPEAGLSSVPAVAFDVGGITTWLTDGVNGQLAPGNPPTADGLAEAIIRCLADPVHHARLRRGAREVARRFSMEAHLNGLLRVFEQVAATTAFARGRS